ncbi:hypothetical protein VNO77_22248 [Canavalia gladiata]|uniref:HMA domain-containing protein n=1 Tax=Canavalia gladiata TaxID=3824 RepID=A0AAN9L3N1_CANGL
MSSSSIPIAIYVDSALSVTVTQMPLFKPLNHLHLVTARGRGRPLLHLHRRLHSIMPVRCSSGAGVGADDAVIVLHVGGMMCEGCAGNVKRILESRPQVSSANVNLTSETATVSPVPEQKTVPNWQRQLGEALAQHLTSCGFISTLKDQEGSY